MSTDCLFCKIARKEIPANLVYEDDTIIAFDDATPKAPIHKLIIPKVHIATMNDLTAEHNLLLGQLIQVAKKLAADLNIAEAGYRITTNCNADAGQVIFHLHFHLLGGKKLKCGLA